MEEARAKDVDVRALVIINPGNPTGQCLSEENMREIIDFCQKERLVLLADEVYQTNVYKPRDRPFHSFKKVLRSMGEEYQNVELFSFHSTSKGMIGECGRRGGYLECVNIDEGVLEQLYKVASISLCPNVHGQIMVDLMTNPPVPGDASYEQYQSEVSSIYESLRRRASKLANCFNSLEGMTCNDAEGAMYLFPRLRLPAKAIEAAKDAKLSPDAFYALQMLEATGVCVIPGTNCCNTYLISFSMLSNIWIRLWFWSRGRYLALPFDFPSWRTLVRWFLLEHREVPPGIYAQV